MISKETLNTLLQEARNDLALIEDALRILDKNGYSLCSEEYSVLLGYAAETKDKVYKLEKKISRLNLLEEILKK